nr:histidinol-phosphate transaminase [Formicincola oecophyllae]
MPYWNRRVFDLDPYIPGEQPKRPLVKLNTNESPYGPSPRALAAIKASANDDMRLYPDPTALKLRQAIAAQFGLAVEQVFAGNGSDEVLAHAFRALLRDDAPALFPDITYGFYPVYCALFDQPFETVPLRSDFTINVRDYDRESGGVVLANPNAQTGIALPLDDVKALLAMHPNRTVIVDEAYVDFGAQSAVSLLRDHPNLLVVRTFSKSSGLAGLRVGYALGSPLLIEGLVRVKDSFNSYPLSRAALDGAAASIADNAWMAQTVARIQSSRAALVAGLEKIGFEVLPSAANFILARHPQHSAGELAAFLRGRDIIVRHFPNQERIKDWLRITIGTDGQCQALLDALADHLKSA